MPPQNNFRPGVKFKSIFLVQCSDYCRVVAIVMQGGQMPPIKFESGYGPDTPTWKGHLQALDKLFERLRHACQTFRPSKCLFGAETIDGFVTN